MLSINAGIILKLCEWNVIFLHLVIETYYTAPFLYTTYRRVHDFLRKTNQSKRSN